MTKLSEEQMLYLLYAVSYAQEGTGTVTKGTVKGYLPKDQQKNADSIYSVLEQKKLIESPKKSRLSVTEQGLKALVSNLQKITNHKLFDSQKGHKVVNTLVYCIQLTSSEGSDHALEEEMDFDTFVEKFKALYLKESKQQSLRGVVAIRKREICQKFMEQNPIYESTLDKYLEMLKSSGKIFVAAGREDEIINWVE